jgi:hypothetical protein
MPKDGIPNLFNLCQTQADPTRWDFGGTMEPPGPASPIDPDLFLCRPDYSHVSWSIVAELDRVALDQLRGKGPHAWVAEGLGNETFAGEVIHTQSDRRVAARSKGRPLASNGNIRRAEQSGEFARLIRDYAIRPGPVLRFAPNGQTSIRSGSMACVKIYQAHQHDPNLLAAEIKRVCMPGALVMLVGIEPCMLLDDPRFAAVMEPLLERLKSLRSRGEHFLRREFRGFPLELENSTYFVADKQTDQAAVRYREVDVFRIPGLPADLPLRATSRVASNPRSREIDKAYRALLSLLVRFG